MNGLLSAEPYLYMSHYKKLLLSLLCLPLIALFAGCVAEKPIGEPLTDSEYRQYEGKWNMSMGSEEGVIEIKATADKDGKKSYVLIAEDPEEGEQIIPIVITHSKTKGVHWLWVDSSDPEEEGMGLPEGVESLWIPIRLAPVAGESNQRALSLLNPEKFQAMLFSGQDNPWIPADKLEPLMLQDEYWVSGEEGELFLLHKLP